MSRAMVGGRVENFNSDAQALLSDALRHMGEHIAEDGFKTWRASIAVRGGGCAEVRISVSDKNRDAEVEGAPFRADCAEFALDCEIDGMPSGELEHLAYHILEGSTVGLEFEGEHRRHHNENDEGYNSMEDAGGVAVGITGSFPAFDKRGEDRLAEVLLETGRFVKARAGYLLGHIKASVTDESGGGVTLNLTNLDNGVERHGGLASAGGARFNFMCAVLDVDQDDLLEKMTDGIERSGLMPEIDPVHRHHNHRGGGCDHHRGEHCGCSKKGCGGEKPPRGILSEKEK